jgi:hypothetical protein
MRALRDSVIRFYPEGTLIDLTNQHIKGKNNGQRQRIQKRDESGKHENCKEKKYYKSG